MKNTLFSTKNFWALFCLITIGYTSITAQTLQDNYDLKAKSGNGLRFWNGTSSFKIHMGTGSEYFYGPVTDYSIKSNMSGGSNRGWTWGGGGRTPIAGLSVLGDFQIARNFIAKGIVNTKALSLNDRNPIASVNGFVNKIEFTGLPHGAIVFKPGTEKELMFGMHDNGNFYWGTGRSATKPDFYGMHLSGSTGNLNILGALFTKNSINAGGSDFRLGMDDNRSQGTEKANRALVHYNNDELHINYAGDFEGGTVVGNGGLHLQSNILVGGWRTTNFSWQGHSLVFGTKPGNYAHNVIEIKPGGASQGSLLSAFKMHHANSEADHDLRVNIDSRTNKPSYFDIGNVGIGTRTPQNKLSVNGTIWAKEVKVSLNDAADWVFEDNYPLRSLKEVETFIQNNKHLPEIPSAEEFRKNDLKVSEITNKLLQKIEELTLYTIEQEKKLNEITVLKESNKALEKKNSQLETRLTKLEALLSK